MQEAGAHDYSKDKVALPEGIPVDWAGFDHMRLIVGNAKQAADWYVGRMGFQRVAYQGLETGCRTHASHVVKQGKAVIVLQSTLNPHDAGEPAAHLVLHGDGVRDVAFAVDDCRTMFAAAKRNGAEVISEPQELTDENGTVIVATIKTYGDTHHTFVQRGDYSGAFLPGYRAVDGSNDPFLTLTPSVSIEFIDHIVGNQPDLEMLPIVEWYERVLGFHRFWSVDDSIIHTEYSSLRSVVMTDYNVTIKMPINEPANGIRKSQIQEYVDYYGGAGVQHVALRTHNIIDSVSRLRQRGLDFLVVPKIYYTTLREKLAASPVKIAEDLDRLEELNILVDYDDNGYLLQIFTKPVEDRPTLFYEIIQRNNHEGFGAGNFKSLFEAIERDQAERGNL